MSRARIRSFASTSFRSEERKRVAFNPVSRAAFPKTAQALPTPLHSRLPAVGQKSSPTRLLPIQHGEILHSAFPRKTFIALLVLGTAAWYFLDISFGRDWRDDYRPLGPTDRPLWFVESKEEMDHIIEAHMPDRLNAEALGQILDVHWNDFEKFITSFAMRDDEAKDDNIPVTHGALSRGNPLCEDRFVIGTSPGVGAEPWNYWGVFDGHAGDSTAQQLQVELVPRVSYHLSNLLASSSGQAIARSLMDAFTRLDTEWMATAKRAVQWYPALSPIAIHAIAPVLSGSCALLACFDPKASKLHVAVTGDSRAVLGRWDPTEGKYVAQTLSVDQTGFNEAEVDRITAEHPDEEGIIDPRTGRLLGMAVTRAFGDHRWKWDDDTILQTQYKYFASPPRPKNKTPPYMTAEPVVTETDVQREGEKPDFMIMATDGLWDNISSEHAIELINAWLDARKKGNGSVRDAPSHIPPAPFATLPSRLDEGVEFQYDPEKPQDNKFPEWKATPEYFAIEDDNAAVCLIKNGLGGRRRGLFHGVFSLPNNVARNAMDDTTVLVVFFGGLDKFGADGKKSKTAVTGATGEHQRRWWKPWSYF
ncbi:phosphatase 2C-like domain-containing protein [Lophiotrema nucula]|uniref:Phosphatase 2C-like domain-containing protein n=1 Tax=Lophiotrema nucula TaxID=690887 RepID=A0A6A5YN48_9PLEO|nr:phosphatase 2C-like domain-containing protein [Lophiotrema nucula]